MFTNYKLSLQNIFTAILILVIVSSITIFLIFNYTKTKNKLNTHIKQTSQITLKRLSNSLAPFIESYSLEEYKKLIKNEMGDPDILAIIIKDNHMGNILGKNNFYTGVIRDSNWDIIEYHETNKKSLQDSFFKVDGIITSSVGSNLGEVSIYYTDQFMQQELKALINESIFAILFISAIIIFVLFITLRKFILNPIFTIVNGLKKTDSYGLPVKQLPTLPTNELSNLSSKINSMIQEIQISRNTLNQYIQRYELTLDGINDGIWDWNIKENTVYFSKRWKSILGYEENEFENTPQAFFNAIHPKDKDKVEQALKKHFENPEKNIYYIETRVKAKNGSYKWILSRGKAIFDNKNNPIRMVGSHTDITEIQRERSFISTIINNANAVIAVIDSNGVMFKVNKYTEEFIGYTQEEIASEPYFWKRFLPSNKRDNIVHIVEKAKQGEIVKFFKNSWFSRNGEERVFEWSNTLVKKADGTMDYLATIGIDVTKREKIQTLILEQKQEFESIFKYSKDGIAITDLETNFLDCNDAYLEITGYTKEELLLESCISLTVPEEREQSKKMLEEVKRLGHIENFEKSCLINGNKRIYANMSISLLPDKKRLLIVTKDVTSLKLFEEQSKLASMGEMIGNIAHQWRQPLSIITTSASGLKLKSDMGVLDQETIEGYSDLVIQQAQYLSNTIDNFRDFIKGDNTYNHFTLSELISQSLSLVDASLKNNYIQTILSIDDDMTIYGNINELTQAFVNIFTNAKDALKENSHHEEEKLIFITTKKLDEESIEVLIKDNGGGIPTNIINRIFEPYFTTKHQSVGTGLGLSMVDKIIRERHHQTITAYNEKFEYNGKKYIGACFKILFKKEDPPKTI